MDLASVASRNNNDDGDEEYDDDDDDIYIRSASRLRALKKKVAQTNHKENKPLDQHPGYPTIVIDDETALPPDDRVSPEPRKTETDSIVTIEICDSPCSKEEHCIAIDDEDYTIDVKINWRSRMLVRLELKKSETFNKVFQHFSEMENLPENRILILHKGKPISKSTTPSSIDLRVIDILEGGILDADAVSAEPSEEKSEATCKIKVQMSTKQKIVVDLGIRKTFQTVFLACAKKLDVPLSRIKLSFDGDEIDPSDTPESLDLEQEACIDLRVSRS